MALKIINPDDFLETENGRVWTSERSVEAWRNAFTMLEAELQKQPGKRCRVIVVCGLQGAGKSTWIADQPVDASVIYFDAALPGARHRKPIIDIAQRHNVTTEVVWIDTPLDIALFRNSRRQPDKIVPKASIRSVASIFEAPSVAEGFQRVHRVDGEHCVDKVRPR